MRRRSRFRASALLLAVVLSAAPAFARGPQPAPRWEVHNPLGSVWHALGGLLPGLIKGRSTIDPNGMTTDGRGTIDPNGATSAAPAGGETDGRWTIDPNG